MRIKILRLILMTIVYFLILSFSIGQSNDSVIISQIDSLITLSKNHQNYNFSQQLLKKIDKTPNNDLKVKILKWIGNYYRLNKQLEKALEIFYQLNEIGQKSNDSSLLCLSFMKLGSTYSVLNDKNKALIYLDKAMKIADINQDSYYRGFILNEYGYLYMNRGDYSKAIKYWIDAKKIMKLLSETRNYYAANANIGIAYTLIGKSKEGLKAFIELYNYNRVNNDSVYFAENCGNIAFAYQKMGMIDSALIYYDSSFYYADKFRQYKTASISYQDLSGLYSDLGDNLKAFNAYKKYHEYEQKAIAKSTQQHIADLEVAYDLEKQKRKLTIADIKIKELKYKARIRYQRIFIIISILIILLILIIVYYYRVIGKLRIKNIEEKLIKAELKNKNLEAIALKQKIENKKNDLTSFSLEMSNKNEFHTELIAKLEKFKDTVSGSIKKDVKNIIKFCNSNLSVGDLLSLKQDDIDKVNQDFFSNLESRFGPLTKNEKYLAASFRLGLSNKEIAAKKAISVSSVKMGRYRLRKKFNLEKNINLVEFLQSL